MEKTKLMLEFEQETGKQSAIVKFFVGGQALEIKSYPKLGPYDYNMEYIAWLEAKAAAYDRLMSGGKKTPKEVADFLGKPIAMDRVGAWYEHKSKPSIGEGCYEGMWVSGTTVYVKSISVQIDYSGDWEHSLTLPDGWEEK